MIAFRTAVVVACVIAISACSNERAVNGGEPEQQLAAATAAGDVARVSQLLASGADPNKIVQVNGDRQSPWFLALYQVRPHQAPLVEIVTLMLKAGANPDEVWGTMVSGGPDPVRHDHRRGGLGLRMAADPAGPSIQRSG